MSESEEKMKNKITKIMGLLLAGTLLVACGAEDAASTAAPAESTEPVQEEVSEDDKKAFEKNTKTLTDLFRKALNNDKLEVKVEKLKDETVSSMLTVSEESRRMADMMKMYSMPGMDMGMFGGEGDTLVLNANNALVKYLVENKKAKNASMFAEQLYDLAVLANRPLSPEAMTKFVARSNQIMLELTNGK